MNPHAIDIDIEFPNGLEPYADLIAEPPTDLSFDSEILLDMQDEIDEARTRFVAIKKSYAGEDSEEAKAAVNSAWYEYVRLSAQLNNLSVNGIGPTEGDME